MNPSVQRSWNRTLASGSPARSEEHTSELQSQSNLVCRLLLEKKKIREQYFPRHIERIRRAGIGIDSCAMWPCDFSCRGRDRNDSCRAERCMSLAGDANDHSAA